MLSFLLSLTDNPEKKHLIETIFNNYKHKMLAVTLNILRDQQLAEDAVQDTFVSVIKNIDKLDQERNVEGYLLRSARNRAIDIIRRSEHEISSDTLDEEEVPEHLNTFTGANDVDAVETAARLVAALPDKLSDVFILYYHDNMDYSAIADKLGISYDAVLKRMERARKLIQKRLSEGEHKNG